MQVGITWNLLGFYFRYVTIIGREIDALLHHGTCINIDDLWIDVLTYWLFIVYAPNMKVHGGRLQKVVETVMKLILSLEYFWLICQSIIYKQEMHIKQDINA